MRITKYILFLSVAMVLCGFSYATDYPVIAYVTSYSGDVETFQYDKLTCINYSFARPVADGSIQPLNDPDRLHRIVELAHAAGVKVTIAIGGWMGGDDSAFEILSATASTRLAFANNALAFVNEYDLDGVDIDWEFPDAGASGENFADMMSDLADILHPHGKIVTAAVSDAESKGNAIPDRVFDSVDYLNIMAYGPAPSNLTYDSYYNAMDYYLDRGLLPEKAMLGVPFYGKNSANAAKTYAQLVAIDPDAPYKDMVDGYSYNGIETMKRKTRLSLVNGTGVMIWELGQDTADNSISLLTAIDQEILQSRRVLYSTDFNYADVLDGWLGTSGWANYWSIDTQNGRLVSTIGTQNTSVWLNDELMRDTGNLSLKDYTVFAQIDGSAGQTPVQVLARLTDASNFYTCLYNPGSNAILLKGFGGGTTLNISKPVPAEVPAVYILSLTVSGDKLLAEIIDPATNATIAQLEATDSTHSRGTVGFRVFKTTAYINSFSVSYGNTVYCADRPSFDFTGPSGTPDCMVDIYDLTLLLTHWLDCRLIPQSACENSVNF